MSSTYGENIKLSIFGQSHSSAIGMVLDNIPAGLPVNLSELEAFMNRRAPGQNDLSSPRREADCPEFLSGIVDGYTCGAPIAAIIHNTNIRSSDYAKIKELPRPGHADFTAQAKYHGFQDVAGGGHFSGRLTAPLCIAGGLCKQWLSRIGITIRGHIVSIGGVADEPVYLDWVNPDFSVLPEEFPVINAESAEKMRAIIATARSSGDSVGGIVECIVTGLPAGLGDPMFYGMESRIAQIIYGIPAIKGLDFGSGFSGSYMKGSENNDEYLVENGKIVTKTNYSGGILGGITTGMPLVFQTAIKPTPSIAKTQNTVNITTLASTELNIGGRHDPCIVPRVVPVIEAAAAIAIFDAYQTEGGNKQWI